MNINLCCLSENWTRRQVTCQMWHCHWVLAIWACWWQILQLTRRHYTPR